MGGITAALHSAIAKLYAMLLNRELQNGLASLASKQEAQAVFQVGISVAQFMNFVLTLLIDRQKQIAVARPFEVVNRVGKVVYEVLLPASMSKLHPMSDVFLLRKQKDGKDQ